MLRTCNMYPKEADNSSDGTECGSRPRGRRIPHITSYGSLWPSFFSPSIIARLIGNNLQSCFTALDCRFRRSEVVAIRPICAAFMALVCIVDESVCFVFSVIKATFNVPLFTFRSLDACLTFIFSIAVRLFSSLSRSLSSLAS